MKARIHSIRLFLDIDGALVEVERQDSPLGPFIAADGVYREIDKATKEKAVKLFKEVERFAGDHARKIK